MDSQSIDSCIQKTLSSLYPPFESTAATVLCQVLDVVEKTYRGDGLGYLIDFLIPAKRILQGLQQEACLQYCGLLFRHAGWPLCIHEKIVLQLASIDWRLLQPGDFYFQVVPYLRKTPRIVLKCLAQDQHNIEELVLPEVAFSSVFTLEWLEFINSGRMGTSLENCLLMSDDQLFRVPWERVVHPEFIEKTQTPDGTSKETVKSDLECNNGHHSLHMGDLMVQEVESGHDTPTTSDPHITLDNTLDVETELSSTEIEGEYVELSDISVPRLGPPIGSLTQSIALHFKSQQKTIAQREQNNQSLVLILDSEHSNCSSVIPAHCPLQPFMDTTMVQDDKIVDKIVESDFPALSAQVESHSRELMSRGHLGQESVFFASCPMNSCNQTFKPENRNLRHEDTYEVYVQEKDSDTADPDYCTQSSEQSSSEQGNFSTALSFQQESRSHFRVDCEDVEVLTDSIQEPAAEHSRTQGRLLNEALESSNQGLSKTYDHLSTVKESDQSVPTLVSCLHKDICPIENIEGKELESIHNSKKFTADGEGFKPPEVTGISVNLYPVADESLIDMNDQTASDTELKQEHDVLDQHVSSVCDEQTEGVNPIFVNGDLEEKLTQSDQSLETKEQSEQDPNTLVSLAKVSPLHSSAQECPHDSICVTSSSDKGLLPLETLHEDTEEDQGLPDPNNRPSTRGLKPAQSVSPAGKVSDQEQDQAAKDKFMSCHPDLSSTPVVSRRSHSQPLPTLAQDVNLEVLLSEVVCLPGTRDRNGRAVVIINTRNTAWLNPHCNASELGRLFLYFYSILRRDCRTLGLTLLVDARRCSPVPALFKAFHIVQAVVPSCIHGVLLLVEKDLILNMEKPHGVQFDLLTSTKSLHKHIEASNLPLEFDGSFRYCHRDWLAFRMKLEHLQEGCRDACIFLQNAIKNMHINSLPDKAEEATLLLQRFGQLMRTVLEDTRLVRLQTEGGAVLARLRKEESCVTLTEDYREAVDKAAELYNQVDEGVHSLVKLSNKRIQEMEMVIEFETFEDRFQEVSGWIENVGEQLLRECNTCRDSLKDVLQTQRSFKEFDAVACEYCRRGQELLQEVERRLNFSSLEVQKYRLKLQKCKDKVGGFSMRLEECCIRLEKTVKLYQFFDKAYEWALEGMRRLASISSDDCNSRELCVAALESLERYKAQHPEIGEKKFEDMRELAYELKGESGAKQWKFAWSKCQEARYVFEKKLETALRAKNSLYGEQRSPSSICSRSYSDGMDHHVHSERNPNVSYFQNKPTNSPVSPRQRKLGRVLCNRPELGNTNNQTPYKASPLSSASSIVSSAFRMRKMSLQSIPGEDLHLELLNHEPSGSSTPSIPSRPITRKLLRKAQSFDLPGSEGTAHGYQRRLSEPTRRGNTGVFIKGLEVSSTELVDRPCSPRQPVDWSTECLLSERRSSISSADGRSRSSKLRHIIDEMVTTEREYVRSLWYITENYFPEMERFDLPQDLRGKRGIIFGNLEKLSDFHSQYFLKELESCCNHPLRVSRCFLRHKDQFGMYALYSKNKPRSDSLLASHGNIFFKNKQHLLGDKMDLASYLLKPIQRMSKYALLLKDLIKECGEAQEQELAYLRAAEEMVKFQLRHGNDLLAMDAIRDCDVNLKEQGQLVRQDEFTVWLGRKKCQRHVFLFEDLILFSKPKRIEGGLDVYIYKRSFKTADIGLTENSGDSGLRFEIWFRRRKSNDTHILQASNAETKQAWTSDIAEILWQQATRNKEIRMKEMVSMGVGNKPFLDIKPSDAAINNRAIDYIMKGRGARTRASIAVSLFDHSDPYKRTQAPIACSSVPSACGSSSASLLGPLNLHMYVNQTLLPGMLSHSQPFETSSCLEEDELENETSSSQPSMTTESSESSQCMSGAGSSGSDSGCVSNIPQDSISEDAASPCEPCAPYSIQGTRNSSSLMAQTGEKSRFINRQYISANPSHISLSPSTIV